MTPAVHQMSAQTLKHLLDDGTPLLLIDVRTVTERAIAVIDGARLLDQACHDDLLQVAKDTLIVFQCHHGIRSQAAAEYFLDKGLTNLHNLAGGIDAWSQLVDSSVPRY